MSQSTVWKDLERYDFTDTTLVIPSVAVGNVGQLACDLLISSLHMKKIASVYSPALIPVIGYDPYDLFSDNLSSCCELYNSEVKNLAVLQIRAPLVYRYARDFLKDVLLNLRSKGVVEVIVLTSSFAHERKFIDSSLFRYIGSETSSLRSKAAELKWLEHSNETELRIYGGGFAPLLYKICEENSIPCLMLYKYCSEGDNIPDAYNMVEELSGVLPLFDKKKKIDLQLHQPVSWKLLFGRPPPKDIY